MLAILLVVAVAVAAIGLWSARPGPVFSLGTVSAERSCFYSTTKGNYSFWNVFFNITNRGASASAAVIISVDGTDIVREYQLVPSSATLAVHNVVTDASVPTDPACLQHNVTVSIRGYLL